MRLPDFRSIPTAATALAATLAIAFSPAARAEDITVFAAASLTNALAELEPAFEEASGHNLSIAYAGSSALARQIQQGAPADVFISANPGWMDQLAEDGLLEDATRFDLLNNAIVLISHGADGTLVDISPDLDLAELLAGGRLAMALVDAVPAGIYGKAALETLGLWAAVAPQVAQTDNVRAALALVATGEAPYGVVYATDAIAETRVSVVGRFPSDSHPPIVYPVAALAGHSGEAVTEFLNYLQSDAARAAFARQGFTFVGH